MLCDFCKTSDCVLIYTAFCLNEPILCLKLAVLSQCFKTQQRSNWRAGSAGKTNNTNSTLSSSRAAFLGQPWHSTPLKDADFVHALQRESMSTSLLLPRGLHQGVRWIYKEAHANPTAPLQDCERWPGVGKVCIQLQERNYKEKTTMTNLDTSCYTVFLFFFSVENDLLVTSKGFGRSKI